MLLGSTFINFYSFFYTSLAFILVTQLENSKVLTESSWCYLHLYMPKQAISRINALPFRESSKNWINLNLWCLQRVPLVTNWFYFLLLVFHILLDQWCSIWIRCIWYHPFVSNKSEHRMKPWMLLIINCDFYCPFYHSRIKDLINCLTRHTSS